MNSPKEPIDRPITQESCDPSPSFVEKRRDFFGSFALQQRCAMRILFRGGKLLKKHGWRNVAEHSLMAGKVADTLAILLDLPAGQRDALRCGLVIHDWDKRIDKNTLELSPAECAKVDEWIASLPPGSREAMEATKISPHEMLARARRDEGLSLQEIARYADSICDGSQIEPWPIRFRRGRVRYPHLDDAYFQAEEHTAAITETKIAEYLGTKGMEIDPESIPLFIRQKIEEEIRAGS